MIIAMWQNVGLMAIFVLHTDQSVKWYDYKSEMRNPLCIYVYLTINKVYLPYIPETFKLTSSFRVLDQGSVLPRWYTNLITDNFQFLPLMWVGVWMIWVSKCQLIHCMYQACVFWDVDDLPQTYPLFSMFPPTVFGSCYENLGEVVCTAHRSIAMS